DDATYNDSTGTFDLTIENQKGAHLPTTGGIGTTLFYRFGAILVVGCGIVLVSRKRMENK
ncbi:MAG: LPXTG cell wall anchor domain-containing protein, partial [Mogibacterium sp.]|nr:LPXTG cell wall anchor domain-containing protein [Mogibacterium sp.]